MSQTLLPRSARPRRDRPDRFARAAAPAILVLLLTALFVLLGCSPPGQTGTPGTPSASMDTDSPDAPASPSAPMSPLPSPSEAPEPPPDASPAPTSTAPAHAGFSTILSPVEGESVTGPVVKISGTGTAFEALLEWEVLRAGTTVVVVDGTTEGGSMGDVGPWSFTVELEPGWYTAQVWAPNMAGAAAGASGALEAAPEDRARIDLVAVTFLVVAPGSDGPA